MTVQTRFKAKIDEALIQAAYQIGQLNARMEHMHTCGSSERYPWPPDETCQACRGRIERFVESNHLEMAYKLFGFQMMVEHFWDEIEWRGEMAKTRRSLGSGI